MKINRVFKEKDKDFEELKKAQWSGGDTGSKSITLWPLVVLTSSPTTHTH
jgi:hypothetical protein